MKRKRKAKRKSPAEPEAEDEVENDAEAEEDVGDRGGQEDEIQMDFEFHDPDEEDYHGVAEHLKSGTWDFLELNFSELTDCVVGQGNIGTLIKSDADSSTKEETVCGLLTVLNLQQFKHQSWPSAISKALLAKAKKHAGGDVAEKLQGLLEKSPKATQVGLLLNERFVNLPPELVPPLHSAMQADIEWSCTTPECPEDERPFYRFTHFVGVARLNAGGGGCGGGGEEVAASSSAGAAPRKKKKQRTVPQAAGGGQAEGQSRYLRFEDEMYVKRSDFSFAFPLSSSRQEGAAPEHRAIFAISRAAFEQVVRDLAVHLKAAV